MTQLVVSGFLLLAFISIKGKLASSYRILAATHAALFLAFLIQLLAPSNFFVICQSLLFISLPIYAFFFQKLLFPKFTKQQVSYNLSFLVLILIGCLFVSSTIWLWTLMLLLAIANFIHAFWIEAEKKPKGVHGLFFLPLPISLLGAWLAYSFKFEIWESLQVSSLALSLSSGIASIRYLSTFQGKDLKAEEPKQVPESLAQDKEEVIEEQRAQAIVKKINELFLEERPYLDSHFSLDVLSKLLKTNKVYVSAAMNKYDISFSDLVNHCRIEEAKKLLKDDKNRQLTLEAIAQMVGYQSRSTFNTQFKRIVGLTPGAYQKNDLGGISFRSTE